MFSSRIHLNTHLTRLKWDSRFIVLRALEKTPRFPHFCDFQTHFCASWNTVRKINPPGTATPLSTVNIKPSRLKTAPTAPRLSVLSQQMNVRSGQPFCNRCEALTQTGYENAKSHQLSQLIKKRHPSLSVLLCATPSCLGNWSSVGVAQLCIEQPADFQRGEPEIPQLSPRYCGKQLTMKWINNNYTVLMNCSGNTNTHFIRTADWTVRRKQIKGVQENASTTLKKCTQVFFSAQKNKTKQSCSPQISSRMS